jgi:hypothetical protein
MKAVYPIRILKQLITAIQLTEAVEESERQQTSAKDAFDKAGMKLLDVLKAAAPACSALD